MLLMLLFVMWTRLARGQETLKRWTPVFALLLFAVLLGACVSGEGGPAVRRQGPTGTFPGTYRIMVNATSGTQTQSQPFTLTVN